MKNTEPSVDTARSLRDAYWLRTRRLTGKLLLVWVSSTFSAIFFARELSTLSVFGWPLSFYLAAQGLSLLFLLILATYAWRMRAFDAQLRAALARLEPPA
jgi:putative solute:sodium symporter small subunit